MFAQYYYVGLLVCWWASGMAYLVSAALPPSTVLMSGVFVALILGAFVQVCVCVCVCVHLCAQECVGVGVCASERASLFLHHHL